MLKALFILKTFNFCPDFFGHVGKRRDKKAKINFKIYNVTDWETNNYNTRINKCLKRDLSKQF